MTKIERHEGPAAQLRRGLPDDLADAFGAVAAHEPFSPARMPPEVTAADIDLLIGCGLVEYHVAGEGPPMARLRYRLSPAGCHVHHAWSEMARQSGQGGAREEARRGLFALAADDRRKLADECLEQTAIQACDTMPTSCRVWTRGLNASGYATVWAAGTSERVHRITLAAYKGLPPPGKPSALHLCGRKDCICPDHLEWGDARENARQHVQHRRIRAGEPQPEDMQA